MESEFGLMHVWTQGDSVTRGVLLILVGMSLLSWMVILIKVLDIFRARRHGAAVEGFWHASDLAEGLTRLGHNAGNPFRQLAMEGRAAAAHHRATAAQLHDTLDPSEWIARALQGSIDQGSARLQSGLTVLASIGSTAPFVGLFGTVWGIYHALMKIGAAGQASIDQVAGPIGEALIMTALGLAVAIPAVLGYNALLRGSKGILAQLRRFARDLLAFYVTGARVGTVKVDPDDSRVVPIKQA